MGRILGIDFGLKRIGLAISDERKIIAFPLTTLLAAKTLPLTVELIKKEVATYKTIETIVIGLPLLLSGKESEMSGKARLFGAAVQESFGIPVIFWDERLTSQQVEKLLKSVELNRKERAKHSDTAAAATLLQSYLDSLM